MFSRVPFQFFLCACVYLQLHTFKHLYIEEIVQICVVLHPVVCLEVFPDQNMLDYKVILNCCFIFHRRAVLLVAVLASLSQKAVKIQSALDYFLGHKTLLIYILVSEQRQDSIFFRASLSFGFKETIFGVGHHPTYMTHFTTRTSMNVELKEHLDTSFTLSLSSRISLVEPFSFHVLF